MAEIDPALVERMVALVRQLADQPLEGQLLHDVDDEARSIVAELPEPVDPDDEYAERLLREQGWGASPSIGCAAVARMIAQAHRDGRQESTR